MKILQTLFIAALATTCMGAFAQWQWVDKDGRKVYSDRAPPADILDKNILKRPMGRSQAGPTEVGAASASAEPTSASAVPAVPASAAGSNVSPLDKEIETKKKLAAEAEVARKKAEVERIAKAEIESCALAKQAKASLDSGVRISRTNAAGEREVMDDAARANELKRIAGIMKTDCK